MEMEREGLEMEEPSQGIVGPQHPAERGQLCPGVLRGSHKEEQRSVQHGGHW